MIDMHSHPSMPLYHQLLRDVEGLGPSDGFPYRTFHPPKLPAWSPEWAMEVMEQENIRAQVLSLPDATVGLRGGYARSIARHMNEAMAEIVGRYPGRFGAFAVLPHDDVDSTLLEIEYALDVLKLEGICTTTNIRGTYLGDSVFDPWLEELHRRSAVLFVHPTAAVVLNPVTPTFMEFCFDSSRMVINMVLSGAKRKYSGIKLISTHGGGTIPYISHRLELFEPILGRTGMMSEEIKEDLRSFYYDLTSCMSDVPLSAVARFVDPSKLLMGFDFPYVPSDIIGPEVARFQAFGGFDDSQKDSIREANAALLFPRLARA